MVKPTNSAAAVTPNVKAAARWARRLGYCSVLVFPAPFAIGLAVFALLNLFDSQSRDGLGDALVGATLGSIAWGVHAAILTHWLKSNSDVGIMLACVGIILVFAGFLAAVASAARTKPALGFFSALSPVVLLAYLASNRRRLWLHLSVVVVGLLLMLWGTSPSYWG